MYGLSKAELLQEPADEIMLNLRIEYMIKDKQRLEAEHG